MKPVICPHCGIPMNHHASKILQSTAESAASGNDVEEQKLELHTCPECGGAASTVN